MNTITKLGRCFALLITLTFSKLYVESIVLPADSGYINVTQALYLAATTVSTTEIDLDWNDVDANEEGYQIAYREVGESTWIDLPDQPANTEAVRVASLNPDTAYEFQVRAFNVAGNSSYSASASATTDEL